MVSSGEMTAGPQTEPKRLINRYFVGVSILNAFYNAAHLMGLSLLPLMLDSMGASGTIIGLVTTSNVLLGMILRPLFGRLTDIYMKRKVIAAGLAAVLLCLAGIGFSCAAMSVAGVFIFRTLQGAGAAAVSTGSRSITAEVSPRSRLVDAIGIYGVINAILSGFAPGILLSVIEGGFFLRGLMCVIAMKACALVTVLINRYDRTDWFINRQKEIAAHKKDMKPERGISRYVEKAAIPSCVLLMLIFTATSSSSSFLLLYAAERGMGDIGLYYVLSSIGAVAIRFVIGPAQRRFGDRKVLLFGLMLLVIDYAVIARMDSLPALLAAALGAGIGTGIYSPIVEAMAMSRTAPERYGIASSTSLLGIDMGYIIGSAMWGVVADAGGYKTVFIAATGLLMIAVISTFFLVPSKKKQ